jgi:hypothetical protein
VAKCAAAVWVVALIVVAAVVAPPNPSQPGRAAIFDGWLAESLQKPLVRAVKRACGFVGSFVAIGS